MVATLKMPSPFSINPAERRNFERRDVQTRIEGKRLDHSIPARQQPQVSLSLRDLSLGGLAAISDRPLGTGERVAFFFPPQGSSRGWDACGRILRCSPSSFGYQIAVEFDPLPAAA